MPMLSISMVIIVATVVVSWQCFSNSTLFSKLLFNPYSVKHQREYYRILSHMLVHADWTHLLFNLFTFYSFGTFMEKVFTSERMFNDFFPELSFWGYSSGQLFFVLLYVLGGAVATLPSLRKHGDNYGYNAVGASGAVSAVMMAFMILFPTFEISFFLFIPMPAWIGALVFLGLEHYLSRNQRSNIAHDAHIWGALFGILFVAALQPRFIGMFVEKVWATLPF
jgi:membrane associated rhomboid family serine protease